MGGREDLRALPQASLHVTLVFLGGVEPGRVEALWEAVERAAVGCSAPSLALSGLTGLPRRRPRLFALGLADEGGHAAELRGSVAGALSGAGLYEREGRRFWPHVTLARMRGGERTSHLDAHLPVLQPFRAPVVTLYRSHPGSDYEPLERLTLPWGT